jgi:hypothetical protein
MEDEIIGVRFLAVATFKECLSCTSTLPIFVHGVMLH